MNNLRELRIDAGMKQQELARICQQTDSRIEVGMISRFENGVCLPTPAVAKAIADAFRVDVGELYGIPEQFILEGFLSADVPIEPESMDVTNLISYLSECDRPIKRGALAVLMDCSDRELRRTIEDARRCGYLVVNGGDGSGYFLARNTSDIVKHFHTEERRAMSILQRLKKARELLKQEGLI